MDICVLIFGRPIYWKVSPANPVLYQLRSSPGVHFISPILFGSIERLMDAKPVRAADSLRGQIGDLWLLETAGIAFKIDPAIVEQHKPKNVSRFASYLTDQAPPLIEEATSLLNALRHFSKQAEMCTGGDDLNFWEWLELEDLPKLEQPKPDRMQRSIARSIVAEAVTTANIEAACNCIFPFRAPIYDTIFLDAIGAHAAHDYRKSILYSAIALESAVATILDEKYETMIKPASAPEWRTIELPVGAGKIVRKDPVWELLKRREDANSFLHEGALYILGKSLLVQDQSLFQLVQRLRSTRNKIVHQGEPPDPSDTQYLNVDGYGSSDALGCVNAVFDWLGVAHDYKLYESGMVSLSNAESNKSGAGDSE